MNGTARKMYPFVAMMLAGLMLASFALGLVFAHLATDVFVKWASMACVVVGLVIMEIGIRGFSRIEREDRGG